MAGAAHTATFATLGSFNGSNGANPTDTLYADTAGNLFGTTYAGGRSDKGTVFEMPKGGAITTFANVGRPSGPLVADAAGNLYGIGDDRTGPYIGTAFKLSPAGAVTTIATFTGPNGGSPSSLSIDAAGNLYGTSYGDIAQIPQRTVFKIDKASGAMTMLAVFNGTNGSGATGGVVRDGTGNLYGTTRGGIGAAQPGTVFKIAADGTLTTLATFTASQGAGPKGLITDAAGDFYGTITAGGANLLGAVFKVTRSGVLTTLASFSGANGQTPQSKLLIDAAGNLFGTTYGGGAFKAGTFFELPKGGVLTTLRSFKDTDGQHPIGALIADASGTLYGTTYTGGQFGKGTVFDISDTGFVVFGTGAVPEPATWALMIAGFGIVGTAARRRRTALAA